MKKVSVIISVASLLVMLLTCSGSADPGHQMEGSQGDKKAQRFEEGSGSSAMGHSKSDDPQGTPHKMGMEEGSGTSKESYSREHHDPHGAKTQGEYSPHETQKSKHKKQEGSSMR